MTPDTWHLTCDTWHVTSDTWWSVNILSEFQLPSSNGLGFMKSWGKTFAYPFSIILRFKKNRKISIKIIIEKSLFLSSSLKPKVIISEKRITNMYAYQILTSKKITYTSPPPQKLIYLTYYIFSTKKKCVNYLWFKEN